MLQRIRSLSIRQVGFHLTRGRRCWRQRWQDGKDPKEWLSVENDMIVLGDNGGSVPYFPTIRDLVAMDWVVEVTD